MLTTNTMELLQKHLEITGGQVLTLSYINTKNFVKEKLI